MRRGFRPTLALLTRSLHNDLRSPCCQRLHRGTECADVPGSLLPPDVNGTALKNSQAVSLAVFGSALPSNVQGSYPYQHNLVSFFCTQNQHTEQEGPDISLLDPALQQQWDHAKNAHLGSVVISPLKRKKVWWRCDKCPHGLPHSWSASVNSRALGSGCPQCRGRKVCKHNSLATMAPKVAAQWDYQANIGTPESVLARSCQTWNWHCGVCGHKWSAAAAVRVRGKATSGCSSCGLSKKKSTHPTFAECKHPLLAEWDHERNAAHGNRPDTVRLMSAKHIFWLCTKCPAGQEHSWSARPDNRLGQHQSGCPMCAGKVACKCNSLQALYPETAAEWDHSKNKDEPSDHPSGSSTVVWWVNLQRGSWQQTIHSRTMLEKHRTARLKNIQQRQHSAT